MTGSSYRTILRSSSIVGGAQVVNIAVGLVKMKFVAVLLGPAGVGLAGLYLSIVQTASSIAALGIGSVGTRQIAAAHAAGGDEAVGLTRRALFWGTMVLALVGAALFWFASGWIARVIVGDAARSMEVAWLSLGVACSVAAGSQGAMLTGLRRIGDLAQMTVGAGSIGAVLGVLSLWLWGDRGLVVMVLIAPTVTFLLGHLFVARLGPPAGSPPRFPELASQWRVMVSLGIAFMLSGLVMTLSQLAVRGLVQRDLGIEAQGYFQASWAIGMTYLGFVLGAMGTDFFPRLTAAIHDHESAVRLVNEQTEVALLLCTPVLLAMLGLAPWVIRLLYSEDFGSAVDILRWQLLGDILKVMSWPLGFVLLASGAGKTFLVTESLGMGVFVLGVVIGLPWIGVEATGVAFLACYVCYLPTVWWFGGRRIQFGWSRAVKVQGAIAVAAAITVNMGSRWSEPLGAILGLGLAAVMGIWGMRQLSAVKGTSERLVRISRLGSGVIARLTRR